MGGGVAFAAMHGDATQHIVKGDNIASLGCQRSVDNEPTIAVLQYLSVICAVILSEVPGGPAFAL
jgi:hypothetical protein